MKRAALAVLSPLFSVLCLLPACSTTAPQVRRALPVPKVDGAIASSRRIQQTAARTATAIEQATAAISRAKVDSAAAAAAGATVEAQRAMQLKLAADLTEAETATELARTENKTAWAIAAKQERDLEMTKTELIKVATDYQARVAEANQLDADLQKSRATAAKQTWLAWKWRLISFGILVAVASLFVFRAWLKGTMPFLFFWL